MTPDAAYVKKLVEKHPALKPNVPVAKAAETFRMPGGPITGAASTRRSRLASRWA